MLYSIYSFIERYQILDLLKNIFYFGFAGAFFAFLLNPLKFLKILRQQTGR